MWLSAGLIKHPNQKIGTTYKGSLCNVVLHPLTRMQIFQISLVNVCHLFTFAKVVHFRVPCKYLNTI